MRAVKVTAILRNGLSVNDDLSPSLESILAYFHIENKIGHEKFIEDSAMNLTTTSDDLPVSKNTHNDKWWYNCSRPFFDREDVERVKFYKKFNQHDHEFLNSKTKKIELTKNQYKNYSLHYDINKSTAVSWHIICDEEKIKHMLSECSQIGGNRNKGCGDVVRWTFDDGDKEKAMHERFLPLDYAKKIGKKGTVLERGFRPCFRKTENRCVGVI